MKKIIFGFLGLFITVIIFLIMTLKLLFTQDSFYWIYWIIIYLFSLLSVIFSTWYLNNQCKNFPSKPLTKSGRVVLKIIASMLLLFIVDTFFSIGIFI